METKHYTLSQVCEIVGENPKRIQYWILQRVFEPFDPSAGTGRSRRFSFKNLLEISIASALFKITNNIKIVRYLMHQIHRDAPKRLFQENDSINGNHDIPTVLLVQMVGAGTVSHVLTQKAMIMSIPDLLSMGLPIFLIDIQELKVLFLKNMKEV